MYRLEAGKKPPAEWFVWEADSDDDRYKQLRIANPRTSSFFHDSIHDVESLLWVLVYIALTREGPGIDTIREERCTPGSVLCRLVDKLFHADGSVLVKFKGELLQDPARLEMEIFPLFHPFFDHLKQVILDIWNRLILGYRYRAYEYHGIIGYTIAALDKTLKDLEENPPHSGNEEYEELRRKEVERRKGYIARRLAPFRSASDPNPVVARAKRTFDSDSDRQEGPSHKRGRTVVTVTKFGSEVYFIHGLPGSTTSAELFGIPVHLHDRFDSHF